MIGTTDFPVNKKLHETKGTDLNHGPEFHEKGPPRTIIRKVILLFILLIAMIIGNAAFSTFKENRLANQQLVLDIQSRLVIVDSILYNEIDKLNMVTGIVREQKVDDVSVR